MDLGRIGHIGAEVAVVGTVAYVLMKQNQTLQTKVEVLEKQLAHVALHSRNLNQALETRLLALYDEIEKLKKVRERPIRAREILRATAIEDESPLPARPKSRKFPPQEPSSPLPPTTVTISPLPPPEEDEESDPEAVLKRA